MNFKIKNINKLLMNRKIILKKKLEKFNQKENKTLIKKLKCIKKH